MNADAAFDPAAGRYVHEAVARLRSVAGERLEALYVIGSLALGDYVAGRSDIDLLAVCKGTLSTEEKQRTVAALSHPGLPCPTRGLEFVLYDGSAAAARARSPRFTINLNTGPGMEQHVTFDPSTEPAHWFVLDIAIARQRAIAVHGPPANEVFAVVPDEWVLDALIESLDWHAEHESLTHYSVLNASRAWRFAEEGVFASKAEAAMWARDSGDAEERALIDAALAIRKGDGRSPLEAARVRSFVYRVRERVATSEVTIRRLWETARDARGIEGRVRAAAWKHSAAGRSSRGHENDELKPMDLDIIERAMDRLSSLTSAEEERYEQWAADVIRLRRGEFRGSRAIMYGIIEQQLKEEAARGVQRAQEALARVDAAVGVGKDAL